MTPSMEQALAFIRSRGVIRTRELDDVGIGRGVLPSLCDLGAAVRLGRGLYAVDEAALTQAYGLIVVSKAIPKGVVCLLSALSFHELTAQNPSQVWVAVDRKGWSPKLDLPYLRLVKYSARALGYGVEEHGLDGVSVRVYSPAKTVADCFKYRNKIGMEIALEALRDCLRQRKASVDQLLEAAEVCRVAKIMRPYLESLL